jgi:DNA-binding NarL/FixJ family response regulator
MPGTPVRVLIADDADVIRKAIRGLLACEPNIEVCGEARSFSMSLWQDEETQTIAQGYGAVALLDKGKLFDELIPAIQRVSRE